SNVTNCAIAPRSCAIRPSSRAGYRGLIARLASASVPASAKGAVHDGGASLHQRLSVLHSNSVDCATPLHQPASAIHIKPTWLHEASTTGATVHGGGGGLEDPGLSSNNRHAAPAPIAVKVTTNDGRIGRRRLTVMSVADPSG